MNHDAPSGTCAFRKRIPAGHLRRSFGRKITDAIRRRGAEALEELGAAPRTLPNFGQVYADLTREARETLPDFEETLASRDRAASLLFADAQVFASVTEGATASYDVDECILTPEGFAVVGVYSRDRRVEIREGDAFLGGAVFTADLSRGTCAVSARLVRLVCANGMILPPRAAEGVQAYERSPLGDTRGSIEETVRSAFSGQVLQQSVHLLGPAASWHVTYPLATLAQLDVALDEETARRVLEEFQASDDYTVYGTVNALSQTARETANLRKRIDLETQAGGLLPRLELLAQQFLSQAPQSSPETTPESDPVRS